MLVMVDPKQAKWVYSVARNVCGSFFLRISDICFAETDKDTLVFLAEN